MLNSKKDYWKRKPLRMGIGEVQLDFYVALQRDMWVCLQGEPKPEWYHRAWRNYEAVRRRYGIKGMKKNLINKSKSFSYEATAKN